MEKKSILRRSILYKTEVDQLENLIDDDGQQISHLERIISEASAKKLLKVGTWQKVEKFEDNRKWIQMEKTEKI
jgi:hypothetical protein